MMVLDLGLNINRPGTTFVGNTANEMSHLFYITLGNVSDFNISGVFDNGCIFSTCLTNTGLFTGLQSFGYWSGLEFAPNAAGAWNFRTSSGSQFADAKSNELFALAVHPGDVAAVPIPATVWLVGSGLLGMAGFRRKKAVPAHS